MEHFNGIILHKSKPANKQHTNRSSLLLHYHTLLTQCIMESQCLSLPEASVFWRYWAY